jgi:hypothetical protein
VRAVIFFKSISRRYSRAVELYGSTEGGCGVWHIKPIICCIIIELYSAVRVHASDLD